MLDVNPARARSVLVVDDDGDVRESIADAVLSTGRTVFMARDGADALALLDGPLIPRPCLILLDWLMAPVDGAEFLAHLASRHDRDALPVVVTSASRRGPDTQLTGVVGTLHKPFSMDELQLLLDRDC